MTLALSFGTVTVHGSNCESAVRRSGKVEVLELTFAAAGPVTIEWQLALDGVAGCWRSGNPFHKNLPADYQLFRSHVSAGVPAALFFDGRDRNLFAFCASEGLRQTSIAAGINEPDNLIHCALKLPYFPAGQTLQIRFDRRRQGFANVLRDAFGWSGRLCQVRRAPESAFRPVYSTWYSYHQSVHAEAVEAECRAAVKYGIGTVIVDDGWHLAGTRDSYSYCGDWQVDPDKFPDFTAHVKRVQALDIKYMLWIALPFLGHHTKAFTALKNHTLYEKKEWGLHILDPRCPEVRKYLADRLEELAATYGIDGFKLDFIEQFQLPGGDNDGHLAEAVDQLLREITDRLQAVKPGILVEFRRPYESAALRRYANMFRAGDCPADFNSNRIQTLDLRLLCPEAATHSDMLTWGNHERAAAAAQQLLPVLFGVPQISVKLNEIPPGHRQMLQFWLGFFDRHRDTLLRGKLRLAEPGSLYPYALAESRHEAIHLLAARDRVINVSGGKTHYLINAAGAQTVCLQNMGDSKEIEIRDARGKIKKRFFSENNVLLIPINMSDLITVTTKNKEIQ